MDSEAITNIGNGFACGLTNYNHNYGLTSRKWEQTVNDRLAALFTENRCSAEREVRYSHSRQKCDLLIDVPLIGKLWLEVKPAWKTWFSSSGRMQSNSLPIYKSYLFGNTAKGLSRTHSFAQDFEKLQILTAEYGRYAGHLLIGFDSEDNPMISDILAVANKLNLSSEGWQMLGPETWADKNCQKCRFHVWFFCKRLRA